MSANNGGPAFPQYFNEQIPAAGVEKFDGMTLHDYFAAKALANPCLATGKADDWQLDMWFGKYSTGITTEQVVAAQCSAYADAMLKAREA